jgi:hypothetical protein
MRTIRAMFILAAGLVLAACGGSNDTCYAGPGSTACSTGTAGSTTADMVLVLSKSNVANTGSDSVIITTTVLDASRNTLAGAMVAVSADSDAIVSTPTSETGADGTLLSTLTIGSNRANRVITVTATSGTVTKTTTVQVFGAKLTSTLVPEVIEPGKAGNVQYLLVDQAGNPMANQDIQVVAAGLTPAEAIGKTGANGDFVYAYTAPTTTGNYDVVASAGGTADPKVLQVKPASTIPSIPEGKIQSASVSANPSVVGTNLVDATTNRSEIRALFLGLDNKPIQYVRVKFDLDGDANSIGGAFTTGREMLYSDVNGVARTWFVPATRSSPTNGVTVRACYYTSDDAAAADPYDASGKVTVCANPSRVTLTVTSEPLGVSIGTNKLIIVNELTYVKKFVVSVVDSAGVAKPDVNITVSVDLPQYRKGYYVLAGDHWEKAGALPSGDAAVCSNEDTNRNGVLEAGENLNGAIPYPDGTFNTRLDPGKSDVSISLLQTKTRADGTAELQLQYAKSFATWVDATITVAASGVSGTEGRASYLVAPVPADAASIKNKDVAPAYVVSPYGYATSCTDPN